MSDDEEQIIKRVKKRKVSIEPAMAKKFVRGEPIATKHVSYIFPLFLFYTEDYYQILINSTTNTTTSTAPDQRQETQGPPAVHRERGPTGSKTSCQSQ